MKTPALIRTQDLIRTVASRYRKQYPTDREVVGARSTDAIYYGLLALPETATAKDVAFVMGDDSWVQVHCDQCNLDFIGEVVLVGAEQDYNSSTCHLCPTCAKSAFDMISEFTDINPGSAPLRSAERYRDDLIRNRTLVCELEAELQRVLKTIKEKLVRPGGNARPGASLEGGRFCSICFADTWILSCPHTTNDPVHMFKP